MPDQSSSLSFRDWVTHVFNHPVTDPQWYFDGMADGDDPDVPTGVILAHMTQLFDDPVTVLLGYDDAQLNQGFWYLVSNCCSNHMFALTDCSAPLSSRIRCIESISSLFGKLFAVRCSNHLSCLSPPGINPLNSVCYMWWDIIPMHGEPNDPTRREIDTAVLSVMESILALDSLACLESALHGLGHWALSYPSRIAEIIDRSLIHSRSWPAELVNYALSAKEGYVN